MKKLLYSGLTALMMLFAFGSAKAQDITLTFSPADGAEVTANTAVTISASGEVGGILYRLFATKAEAQAAASNFAGSEDNPIYSSTEEGMPQVTQATPVIMATYWPKGGETFSTDFVYAEYTVKEAEAPTEPNPTITLNPVSGAINEGALVSIAVTDIPDGYSQDEVYFGLAATKAEAEDISNLDLMDNVYSDNNKPAITAEYPVLKVGFLLQGPQGYAKWFYEYGEYTINQGELPTPVIKTTKYVFGSGKISKDDYIEIVWGGTGEEPDGVEFWYTTDGTTPAKDGATSTQYEGAFQLAEGQNTVMAIAVSGEQTSAVSEAHYTFNEDANLEIVFMEGNGPITDGKYGKYSPFNVVLLMDDEEVDNFALLYTIDGTTEPDMDAYYAQPEDDVTGLPVGPIKMTQGGLFPGDDGWERQFATITLTENATTLKLQAYVFSDGGIGASTGVITKEMTAKDVAALEFDTEEGNVEEGAVVKITNADAYDMIFYTKDGSIPYIARMNDDDDENYFMYNDGIEITETVTLKVIGYTMGGMMSAAGSDLVTRTYTVGAAVEATEVTITLTPATYDLNEDEDPPQFTVTGENLPDLGWEEGEMAIKATFSKEGAPSLAQYCYMSGSYFGSVDELTAGEWTVSYELLKGETADAEGVAEVAFPGFKVSEASTSKFIVTGSTNPGELSAPEFMTDSYGQSRFAKSTDKIRLTSDNDGANIEFYYAITEVEEDGGFKKSGETEVTYVKYEGPISLSAISTVKFTIKAYATDGEKYSDTAEAEYALIDKIEGFLSFATATGKNYPLTFTVASYNYDDIYDVDEFMVYYTLDGKTEPSMEAYFEQEGDTIKYAHQEHVVTRTTETGFELEGYNNYAFCELTQDTTVKAKAYVMLDKDAEVILELPVVSQRVTVNSLENPVLSVSDAEEFNETIEVTITMPEDANVVYYTLDGSEPFYGRLINDDRVLEDSVIFEYREGDVIEISRNTTLKAIAYTVTSPMMWGVEPAGSDVVTANYKFKTSLTFDPASGATVDEGTNVAIIASDRNVDIFYMMFENEAAAKAAEWNQDEAEPYTDEMQPVLSLEKTAIKAAYAHRGATAITDTFFYASYTVKELPPITLTFDPASGSEVEDGTTITVTASRETEIWYQVYENEQAALNDNQFVITAQTIAEDGMPVITKDNPFLKCAVLDKGEMKYFYASYTVKESGVKPMTFTLDPAPGSEVAENTQITITPSRELDEEEYIIFAMFSNKTEAEACSDEVMVNERAKFYGEPDPEDPNETFGYPILTKAKPVIKVGYLSGEDEDGEMTFVWFIYEYTVKGVANDARELAGVNIYPNPTDGEFNVVAPANAEVEIFNAVGVVVKHITVTEGMSQIRLDNSGIYFVRVRANGQEAIKKVVVR